MLLENKNILKVYGKYVSSYDFRIQYTNEQEKFKNIKIRMGRFDIIIQIAIEYITKTCYNA